MRRSAAPSFKSDVKRQCILPKLVTFEDKNINNFSAVSMKNEILFPSKSEVNDDSASYEVRSNEDILNLIEDDNIEENILSTVETTSAGYQNHPDSIISNHVTKPIDTNTSIKCIFCTTKADKEAQLFSVVWCKRSSKKHKTWEGDGYLVVKSRSASLKDLSGKVIDKGMGYKLKEIESLEDGSKLFVGGKECEIQYKILSEEYESGKYCECKAVVKSPLKQVKEESKIFIR